MKQSFFVPFKEPSPSTSFRYTSSNLFTSSIVPEKRGNNIYWYMRKSCRGKTINLYVAPAGKLSKELLENASANTELKLSPNTQNLAGVVQ